jgi:nitrite reductase/ring-hydroxylating ferredoxin subunit
VCTGEPIEPADEDILPRYPVKVEHGHIWVALAP